MRSTKPRADSALTLERLCEALDYDQQTGIFTWKIRTTKRVHLGDVAGSVRADGYREIALDGERFLAHRLAWFYVHGRWPEGDLDHEDTVPGHDWISNLRPATRSENNANSPRPPRHNTSGLKGVHWHKGARKWIAQIQHNRRYIYLGLFESEDAARAAYVAKKIELCGHFANELDDSANR